MKFSRRSFTLIEMLLVASLLSVTGLAVYHAIANGVRVWEYSRRYSSQQDVAIFLEKIATDLQDTFSFSLIVFEGKTDKIFIPTMVRMLADSKTADQSQMISQMGRVEYYYQKSDKTIYRRQSNYSQSTESKAKVQARSLVIPVEDLRFSYFIKQDGKLKQTKKVSGIIPVSVEVDIDFMEAGGNIRHLKRMINIPVGSL